MKILKIFGIVAGIHVFALVLLFANPGCSSTTKPAPAPADTLAHAEAAPAITPAPAAAPADSTPSGVSFNPDAPAVSGAAASADSRYRPTRPGTPEASTLVKEAVTDVTPVTTYTVKSGDNLSTIAKRHNVTVAELTRANQLNSKSTLRPGQKLKIPQKAVTAPTALPASSSAAVPARSSSKELRHVVKSGETLGGIARIYGVRTGDIAAANHIADPAKIRPGMELVIPGWESPAAKSGRAPKSGSTAKPAESRPAPAPEPTVTAAEPAPATPPPPVPVISVEDTPISPAPKP